MLALIGLHLLVHCLVLLNLSVQHCGHLVQFLFKLFVFNIQPFDIFFECLELSFLLESAFLCRFSILYKSFDFSLLIFRFVIRVKDLIFILAYNQFRISLCTCQFIGRDPDLAIQRLNADRIIQMVIKFFIHFLNRLQSAFFVNVLRLFL